MEFSTLYQWGCHKYGKERVDTQIHELFTQADKMNVMNAKFLLSFEATLRRLHNLIHQNLYIEYIDVGYPLVEYGMKRVIAGNEFLINSSLIFGDLDTPLYIREKGVGRGNNTFGNLLNELERYYDKHYPLLEMLRTFNQKKIEVGHKLYEEHIEPELVNSKIKSYALKDPVLEIVKAMGKEQRKLNRLFLARAKEYGYVSEGHTDEHIEALMKRARE